MYVLIACQVRYRPTSPATLSFPALPLGLSPVPPSQIVTSYPRCTPSTPFPPVLPKPLAMCQCMLIVTLLWRLLFRVGVESTLPYFGLSGVQVEVGCGKVGSYCVSQKEQLGPEEDIISRPHK